MTRIANMLRMKLTQLCVSINSFYFQKKRAFCSCPNFTLSFYSEERDNIKSFKPTVNIYRNIQRPIANMALTNSSLYQIIPQPLNCWPWRLFLKSSVQRTPYFVNLLSCQKSIMVPYQIQLWAKRRAFPFLSLKVVYFEQSDRSESFKYEIPMQ